MLAENASTTRIVRDLTSYLAAALVGMAGYLVWQLAVTATMASRLSEWVAASTIFVAAIALTMFRVRPSASAAVQTADLRSGFREDSDNLARRVAVPLRGPLSWRFDDPSGVVVDRDVERLVPLVKPALERAFLDILDNPLANSREVVRGEVIYIKRVHPATGNILIPSLLVGYTAAQRERLIRLRSVAIGPETDAVSDAISAGDEQTIVALHRLVAAAKQRAGRPQIGATG